MLRSHRRRTVENSAYYLTGDLRAGMRVLDVGCGPGTITTDLAARVAPGEVLGIEPAEAPLHEAREAAAAAGVENVSYAIGDVYGLEEAENTFDVVHAHQVLQHLADPVAALREMLRVCRPDGHVAARDADFAAMTWHPADERLDRWLEIYQAVARGNGAEPDAGRRLLAWAHAAGAGEVHPSASVWCHATPEERAWWGSLWAERVCDSDLAHQAVAGGHAEHTELEDIATAWRAWAAHEDAWFTVLHGEILCSPPA